MGYTPFVVWTRWPCILGLVAGLILPVWTVSPLVAQTLHPSLAQSAPSQAAASEESDLPSVASLFLDLGQDIRRLPSLESAVIVGAGGIASLVVHPKDDDVTRHMAQEYGPDGFFRAGEVTGDLRTQLGAGLAVFAAGRMAGSVRVSTLGADLFRAQVLNAIVTHGTKTLTQRRRPNGGRYSFPSGHASGTFATATVLQRHLGWKAGVPAYALAAYTGASRLAANKHYLSDVVFGAAIGIVMGRTVTLGRGRAAVTVSPFVLPSGVGVMFRR